MGILPGWWLGVNDGRTEEPYLAPDEWDKVLRETGFSGVDAAIFDAPAPWHINANIISRPAKDTSMVPRRPRLSLLHHQGDEHSEFVREIRSAILKYGFQVDLCTLQDPPQRGTDLVSVLELEKPFFESISQTDLITFQGIVQSLETGTLLWITRPAQHNVASQPGFGLSLGLARTLRSELDVSIFTFEVDQIGGPAYAAIARLLTMIHQDPSIGTNDRAIRMDSEFILSGGEVQVGRYHHASLMGELASRAAEADAVELQIRKPGLLQSLQWVPLAATEPGPGEVVVEPRCAGLNFRVSTSSRYAPARLLVLQLSPSGPVLGALGGLRVQEGPYPLRFVA